jgi:hypothetical protein
VDDVVLPVLGEDDLLRESKWLGSTMAKWLDDEWCEQEVHRDIGDSLCEAYLRHRRAGQHEATQILLELSTDLCKVDYTEAFVNPFDVANKAMEILMFKHDMGVCCQSEYEKTFLENAVKEADM